MFDDALAFTLKEEVGYANDPDDPGGATNYGITQRVYSEYRKSKGLRPIAVRYINQEEVREIYFRNYWLDSRSDLIDDFYHNLATVHFDTAVNTGEHQAALFLQRAVHTLVDAHIGPKTLAACKEIPEKDVIDNYLNQRTTFYLNLIAERPRLAKFKSTWIGRVRRLRKFVSGE